MNLLLDTHVALWAIENSPRLPSRAMELILAPENEVWVSSVSIWEISIKHSLARGDMPVSGAQALRLFSESGYRFLAIEPEHAAAIETLPARHRDPFDRLLVAQAISVPLRLLTHDPVVASYSETVILV